MILGRFKMHKRQKAFWQNHKDFFLNLTVSLEPDLRFWTFKAGYTARNLES